MGNLTDDQLVALSSRYQHQRDTLTREQIALIENHDFSASGPPAGSGYDAYNPSPQTLAKVGNLRRIADQVRAAELAEQKPQVKDRAYYRQRWMAGFTGRRECLEHAKSLGMNQGQFSTWLWQDEPRQTAPSATPEALAWAERVLGRGA